VVSSYGRDVGWFGRAVWSASFRSPATNLVVVGVSDQHGTVRQVGDAQRVLQAGLFWGAIAKTEVEEASTNDGADFGLLRISCRRWEDVADRGGFGVGDPQGALRIDRQAGRLREPGFIGRAVSQTFERGARIDGEVFG